MFILLVKLLNKLLSVKINSISVPVPKEIYEEYLHFLQSFLTDFTLQNFVYFSHTHTHRSFFRKSPARIEN